MKKKLYKDVFSDCRDSNYRWYHRGKFAVCIRFDPPQVLIFKGNENLGVGIFFKYHMKNCLDKVTDIMCELISETSMDILYEDFKKIDPDRHSPEFLEVDILEIMIGGGCRI